MKLRDLALHYVGRYATSRKKLSDYLRRKLRERRSVAGPPDGRLRNFLVVGADRFSALAIQLVASQSPPLLPQLCR